MISIVVRCRPRKVDTNIKAQVPGDEMMKLGPVGIVPQVLSYLCGLTMFQGKDG